MDTHSQIDGGTRTISNLSVIMSQEGLHLDGATKRGEHISQKEECRSIPGRADDELPLLASLSNFTGKINLMLKFSLNIRLLTRRKLGVAYDIHKEDMGYLHCRTGER
jgi:hypothetical protein